VMTAIRLRIRPSLVAFASSLPKGTRALPGTLPAN
jgi:hypothetical protein